MNKVTLNRFKKQEMLQDILKKLKPNNDVSILGDIVILKGFPLNNLDTLNKVNMVLKIDDKSFCRKLLNIL